VTTEEGTNVMPDSTDPMVAVRQYIQAFNNGDSAAMAAACADPMQILDGMSPHVWQGPTAAEDWWRDALAEAEHAGATGLHIEVGEPTHLDVKGDYGYIVVPVTFEYDLPDKHVNQTDAFFTFALRKVGTEWRLTAWAWTKGIFR
jgi:ketosteroid isomerase-like protein